MTQWLPNAAAYASVDWGHTTHCIHLLPAGERVEQRFDVAADPSFMAAFMIELRQRFGSGRIAILSKGALENLLLDYESVDLFAVNPRSRAEVQEAADKLIQSGIPSKPLNLEGEPAKVITNEVENAPQDLLAMGAYGHSRAKHLLIGSTTATLARDCHVPILMFR